MSVPFYVVLPDYARARVALVPEGNSFSLPQFSREEGTRYHTVATVNDAVLSSWHVPVTVSRCLVEGQNGLPATFALHNHDESWKLPPPATWIEVNRLKDVSFANPDHRTAVLEWLSSEADESWRHVPWSSPTWFAKVTKWISEYVQSTGATVFDAPIQIRVWAASCVLRVSTTAGTLYFKALPDLWGYEPVLMQYLSKHFQQHMMDVVAIEPQEHWMLTREMLGPEPESKEDWHKALRTLIEIQQHCNKHFDELLSLGCADRRLAQLPTQLQPVLQDLAQPQTRQLYGVTEAEAEELSRRLRTVGELCERLADCGIADTLVHGDFWGQNVISCDPLTGRSPVIFDWTDAAISHPFFDIYLVLTSEKDDAKRKDQRQAHIDVWSEILPLNKVMTAFELSEQIAPYFYVSMYRDIELNTPAQARWELSFLLLRFVRKILEQTRVGDPQRS